ncbi:histone-lysine N-methyltransferase SETMAR [Trichonephila clavipes]|nr:histone-lysine N-methyltransferase SETMAR [Trichonephila clavipes]
MPELSFRKFNNDGVLVGLTSKSTFLEDEELDPKNLVGTVNYGDEGILVGKRKCISATRLNILFGLAIHQNDHQARRRFVEWAQNEIAVVPDFHKRILFSDEAHFWLNGYVNKQNCRIWSEANPQVYVETPLHPEKLTELWFQQDGATYHTARATIDLLKDTFGDRLISRFGPVNWPPRSYDLTQTLDHLEDNIRRVIADIRPQMLEKVIENWTSRLDYIRASHTPEIIFKM